MDFFSRFFIVGVIALDLLAVVYFGGHFLVTGHILPHEDVSTQTKIAQLVLVEKAQKAGQKIVKKQAIPLMPASVERGQKVAGLCLSCHSFKKGGRVMSGPPLWNITDAKIANHDGYAYSQIFLEKNQQGDVWTQENLDAFLVSPRKFAPGTKMSFSGLRKEQQRIDLIAYLKTLK